jgi:hypothetical protein
MGRRASTAPTTNQRRSFHDALRLLGLHTSHSRHSKTRTWHSMWRGASPARTKTMCNGNSMACCAALAFTIHTSGHRNTTIKDTWGVAPVFSRTETGCNVCARRAGLGLQSSRDDLICDVFHVWSDAGSAGPSREGESFSSLICLFHLLLHTLRLEPSGIRIVVRSKEWGVSLHLIAREASDGVPVVCCSWS